MRRLVIGAAAAALVTALVAPPPAAATGGHGGSGAERFTRAVTVHGIMDHLTALQRIADANGGTRVSGTSGHEQSVAYVTKKLRRAGYTVTEQEFTFPFYRETAPPVVAQVSPSEITYDPITLTYSGSGDVTGPISAAAGIQIPPPPEPGVPSGCSATDFAPAPDEPSVALVQRGTCNFSVKANNAIAAGYDAVLIFNEGQAGRQAVFQGTLGESFDIPVVALSYDEGAALYAAIQDGDVEVTVSTSTEYDPERTTSNVIAETRGGDPDRVLVVGAHLDSVAAGPGINDNGSGSATILEIAETLSKLRVKPTQKVRFAFWGAEEYGLLGSEHYVSTLPEEELATIWANLNFDMVASPNYVRFVYDGDASDTEDAGPEGSAQIEALFQGWFADQGLATEPTAFDGRSDYGPFIEAGIPAGGLFSGAEGIKSEEEAAIYGGTAGEPYDSCYHQACDTIDNINTDGLDELGDAAAYAVYTLATATEDVLAAPPVTAAAAAGAAEGSPSGGAASGGAAPPA